jgi:hypothetical protein
VLSDATVVFRNREVAERSLEREGELLLLHRRSGAYCRLNRTGSAIWRHLEEPVRVDALESRLRAELGEAPESFRMDLTAYLSDLVRRDLVRLHAGDA